MTKYQDQLLQRASYRKSCQQNIHYALKRRYHLRMLLILRALIGLYTQSSHRDAMALLKQLAKSQGL
jgi:hypothetical protein